MMRIIIDVNHPGHVHLFKNFAFLAEKEGWKVLFTAKDKEVTLDLLKAYKLNYKCLGKHYTGKAGKIFSLLNHTLRLFFISIYYRTNLFLSHGSVPASWVSFILRRKYIAFEDTGNMEQVKLYKPFAHAILTTECFNHDYGKIQVRYKGYHEIAYLHPKYFKPDASVLDLLGVAKNEKYFILRFISWGASHDGTERGPSDKEKEEIVNLLLKYGKVYITSEAGLPQSLTQYRIKISPEKIHDALAFAELFVGEGLTMASECAVIGTPAILINTMKAATIDEQQGYGLLFQITKQEQILSKLKQLLGDTSLKSNWAEKRNKLLSEKIDITAFTLWFVKNFPSSIKILKEDQSFQEKFK
ncbi:MAG: DUF354 domain-containing protein [Bacteroidales bacterium]